MSDTAQAPVSVDAPAKINLYLHVTGRRDDGFHLLDSLVVFADAHDAIVCRPAQALTLAVTGPRGAALAGLGDDNIILRAARGLAALTGVNAGAAITLDKRLPVAAGIGGGSADAAATLKALLRLWGVAPDPGTLDELALSLGADVPVCLAGRSAYFGGIGEQITPVDGLPRLPLLLVNPGVAVSTPAVFKARQGRFSPPARLAQIPGTAEALAAALGERSNDLEAPARAIEPAVDDVLDAIGAAPGCLLARMSGSGATCFGVFGDEAAAEAAGSAIAAAHPDWWVMPGATRVEN